MWVRKRVDIRWSDLAFALRTTIYGGAREAAESAAETCWMEQSLVCFSVRTSLDLFLQAANFPRGSEVLISAITIPDMVRIVELHGLVAVPVDLDTTDMSVSMDSLKLAITQKTRAVLVAHLFGTITDLTPVIEVARAANLLVFEDCAQAFVGTDYTGHSQSDVVAFSFGPIKTATALGGALVTVQDEPLRKKMRSLHSRFPVQTRWVFAKRIFKYSLLKLLGTRAAFWSLAAACRVCGQDLDNVLGKSVRNFGEGELLPRLRKRPSTALLRLMERRVQNFDVQRHKRRCAAGGLLIQELVETVRCPGHQNTRHSHWVFVIESTNPTSLVPTLRASGFDATVTSQLQVLMPGSSDRETPASAEELVSQMVFLPYYPEMPDQALLRMAGVVKEHAASCSSAASA